MCDVVARPVCGLGRQRHNPVVLDTQHFHLVQVDNRDYSIQRPRIAVVRGVRADPGQCPREPFAPVLLRLDSVGAGRPGVHHDQIDVGDTALAQGLEELGRTLHRLLTFDKLVQHDRRLNAFQRAPRGDGRLRQRDQRFYTLSRCIIEKNDERLALDRAPRSVVQHNFLGRLTQHYSYKSGSSGHPRVRLGRGDRRLQPLFWRAAPAGGPKLLALEYLALALLSASW